MSTVFKKTDRKLKQDAIVKNDATTLFAQNAVIVAVMSTFLHFYIGIAVVALTAISFCILPGIRDKIFVHKGTLFISAYVLISIVTAIYHKNYLGALISVLFAFMMIIHLVARSLATREFFDRMMDIMVIGGCLSTVVCVIEKIVNRSIPGYRCQCFSVNPNCFGVPIMIIILICAYKVIVAKKNVPLYYIAAIINAVSIYLCGSMMLWIIIFIGVLVLLLLNHKYKLLAVFLGVVTACVITVILIPQLISRLHELTATIENRVDIWTFAIEQIGKAPIFGRGFASYNFLYNIEAPTRPELYPAMLSHNLIIDSMLSYGVVGTLLIAGYFICFVKDVLSCREGLIKLNKDYTMITFVCALFVAVMVHGLIDTAMIWIQPGLMIMLIGAGLGVDENRLKSEQ